MLEGYLDAFPDQAKIILRPEIYSSLFTYLGNFFSANGKLKDMATYDSLKAANLAKQELDKKLGYKERSEVNVKVVSE